MIPIKIQCDCGQRYAFDVEPVLGKLATPVKCPVCGADGSPAANEVIAQTLAAEPLFPTGPVTEPTPAPTRMRIKLPTAEAPEPAAAPTTHPLAASAAEAARLGLVDRGQAEIEARAKVSWGDPPEKVLQYLMIQGFTHQEAADLLAVLYKERSAAVRVRGIKKILVGTGMIVGAAAGFIYMLVIRFVMAKLVGVLFLVAVVGLWQLVNGAIMVLAPKMQSGDVAEA